MAILYFQENDKIYLVLQKYFHEQMFYKQHVQISELRIFSKHFI